MFSLIINIESGIVNGTLVKEYTDHSPTIEKTLSKSFAQKKLGTGTAMTNAMLEALHDITSSIIPKNKISKTHIVLSTPWAISHPKSVVMNFAKNTLITESMISDVLEEERSILTERNNLLTIDQKIFEIKINGYEVTRFDNREGKRLGISFSTTVSSHDIIDKINKVISKSVKIDSIEYHYNLILNYISLRKLFPSKNNYIYIHVHDEMTDIIVVKNTLCSHISSFPLGISTLFRNLVIFLNQSEQTSRSTLNLFEKDRLEAKEKTRVQKCVDSFILEWSKHYSKFLDNNAPKLIYLTTSSHGELFKKELGKILYKNAHIEILKNPHINMQAITVLDMI